MFQKENLLYIITALLLVLSFSATYYKNVVLKDYIVAYEYECNPSTESCFVGCEDDLCESEYYYALIEKMAYDVYQSCGNDVMDCSDAFICKDSDSFCDIVYCDPESLAGDTCSVAPDTDI